MTADDTATDTDRDTGPVALSDPQQEFREIWARLSEEMPPSNKAWLQASVPVTLEEHTGVVAVPDEFTRGRLEGRLRVMLEDLMAKLLGRHVRLYFNANPENKIVGLQTMGVGPGDGIAVEMVLKEPGIYPAVNHMFGHAAHGAIALLEAE